MGREEVTDNMQNRFVRAVKKVAPKKLKGGWKQLRDFNIEDIAKIMCNAMDSYQSATEKAMNAFEKCTKDYPDDVRDMIMRSAILRFGVESDVSVLGLNGSYGAGTLYDPSSKEFGCYAQVCAGSMISIGGGDGAAPVVGIEFVESIDKMPTTSYEGSLKVPFLKKYANAYSFSREEPYIAGVEIKQGSNNKIGGSAYICNTFSMKYDNVDINDDDGDDDEGDDLDDGYSDDDVTRITI